MTRVTRRFVHYPLIFIDPKKSWGNPTLGKTRLPIFKIWEMVSADFMDQLLESEPALTLGEINSVMEFVNWCKGLGLIEEHNGRLNYDKDALYQAAELETPPRGRLCLYCHGFIPRVSPTWTDVRDQQSVSQDTVVGVAHGSCVEAVMLGDPAPKANVLL